MLLDGSEMDSFADLTHTPQGDVKTRIARGILMVSDLTHTPQGDTTEGPFLHRTDAAERVLLLWVA